MRPRPAGVLGTLALLGALSASAAVAATAGGSARGIALYHAENRALTRVHTITFSSSGGSWIEAIQGNAPRAGWLWAAGAGRAGMVRARLQGAIGARDGHVVWTRVVITPICELSRSCNQTSLTVVSEPSGVDFAYGTPARHTCFGPAHGPYLPVGSPLTSPAGVFEAPKTHGASESLTFSLPWTTGHTATETDTLARSTNLPRSETIAIPATGRAPAFSIRVRYRYGPSRPVPSLDRCH